MAVEPVFIDTAALLALVNSDDALHSRAVAAYGRLTVARSTLLVTEWVLAEFLNGTARPPMRAAGIDLVNALRASPRVIVVPASRESWQQTFERYAGRADKSWSFVDCASMLACEAHRVRRVLTHDRHFAQAGFELLIADLG